MTPKQQVLQRHPKAYAMFTADIGLNVWVWRIYCSRGLMLMGFAATARAAWADAAKRLEGK